MMYGTGVFISNADGSIVLATYGIMSSELGSLANASWIVVTYGLTMCAVQSMVCWHSLVSNEENLPPASSAKHSRLGSTVN